MGEIVGAEPVILYGLDSNGVPVPLLLGSDGTLQAASGLALGSTPSTQAIGDAASGGSATTASKNDHKHGMPAFGSPASAAYANADGAAATIARSNHIHAIALTSSTTYITAQVTMSTANTFFDGPSVALVAGTWILYAALSIHTFTTTRQITAKLWDGTTTWAAEQHSIAPGIGTIPLGPVVVVLGAGATVKASATATAGTDSVIRDSPADNNPGDFSSFITAIRIG